MKPLVYEYGGGRSGLAILSVLLVLLALLILTAPFLMTARNASRSSSQLADRAQARLALDSAERHARAELGHSHPSVDETPYYDDEEELSVEVDLAPDFLNSLDTGGVMWDVTAEDVAGRIDLNSAGPHVFANMMGATTRLVEPMKPTDDEIKVSSTRGFEDQGVVWIERELIAYAVREPQGFKQLTRGIGGALDADDEPLPCGPGVAEPHAAGTPVIDQRAFAPVEWRIRVPDGIPRSFDAPEQLREAGRLAPFGLSEDVLAVFDQLGSVFAGVGAGRPWQRAARLVDPVRGGLDCVLKLDEARWFAPGTTVRITDGQTTELGVVLRIGGSGVQLMEPLVNDYHAYTAEVRPLARRPVNVNVADAETLEVLLANLQLNGVNSRITRTEARELATLMVAARPFTGLEDLLTRVLLPAAGIEDLPAGGTAGQGGGQPAVRGGTVIDPHDAVAAYANALNANSSRLVYSTMPFCFTSRGVFDLDLRTAVNAPSGIERVSGRRNQVELVVPQRDLLRLFARQEDFDEALRLDREAPWWSTGPAATSRWDVGAVPPSRFGAHIGTFRGQIFVPGISQVPEEYVSDRPPVPVRVFASREDPGWAQLWPARVAEVGPLSGKVMHFDHETRDPEGRFLPDEIVTMLPDDKKLGWAIPSLPLMRCMSMSLWLKSRDLEPGVLFDVGQSSLEADRITLLFEDGELVLRVLDAMGDHSGTPGFLEAGEARYALTAATGAGSPQGAVPGLPANVWTHVAIDVRGNRPDQVTMLVDGRSIGVSQPGLSRLVHDVTDTTTQMALEDGTGFPARGVVRIGREWIEYRKIGPNLLDCSFSVDDQVAPYAGGRFARLRFVGPEDQRVADPSLLAEIDGAYNAGTPVELGGYVKPLVSQVSPDVGTLPEAVGAFRVAYVSRILDGQSTNNDRIIIEPGSFEVGTGLDARSQANALELLPADDPLATGPETLAEAFHQNGGYAALVQAPIDMQFTINATGLSYFGPHQTNSGPIGGVEIIRYSTWDGTTLQIAERGAVPAIGGQVPHAFVRRWTMPTTDNSERAHEARIFVVPVSIPIGPQAGSFPSSYPNRSEFAQITYLHSELPATEWVRYDSALMGHLVRHAADALEDLLEGVTRGWSVTPDPGPLPLPFGAAPVSSVPSAPGPATGAAAGAVPAPAAPIQTQQSAAFWDPYLGTEDQDEIDNAPLSRAARSRFQFRGVFGTYQREHPPGIPVLPTFRVAAGTFDAGQPGRQDPILLVDADPQDLGWNGVIHHTWRPNDYTIYGWNESSPGVIDEIGSPIAVLEDQVLQSEIHVGLEEPFPVPISPLAAGSTAQGLETRLRPRMLKFPSGERPRIVDRVVVGGDIRGEPPPAVVVDELTFGTPEFGTNSQIADVGQGAQLILRRALFEGGIDFEVIPQAVRMPSRRYSANANFMNLLPEDAGLLRLGSEIVCYTGYDDKTGAIYVATNGRGLLGTVEESHVLGSYATFLESAVVTTLAGGVSAGSDTLPITDSTGFPSEGTVLVGDELIHYTRIRQGALEMPRASREPGAMDRKGDGIFRGRYGTFPAAHAGGEPVILFPFRYWDRQAERADGPELAYFGFALDQPGAFWRSVFWDADEIAGSQIYALQRAVDPEHDCPPPWDGDPQTTPGLALYESGMAPTSGDSRHGNSIGVQADRLEWRLFVRYLPGAFDAVGGLSHDWKRTPRVELFGVEYLGPNQVLRRVER